MTASTVGVTVPAAQPAEPSEIVSQDASTAPNSTALATSEPKLAKNFASLGEAEQAAKAFGYDKLDSAATKKEFDTLDAELNKRKDDLAKALAKAQDALEEATPYLSKMQALLSQRGTDRNKVLRDAKVPGWTEWAEAYAREVKYTVRTLQTRIKELREGKKGKETDGPPPTTHYTKAQMEEMVSVCNLAIEAKKGSEAGRPVDEILARIKMDPKRLLDFNETALQLPDYRKCTERLLSVIEKYARREVKPEEVIKVASEIRKEVSPKQAEASLTEAARAGKQQTTAAPVVVDAEPDQAKGAAPATEPMPAGATKPTATSGSARQVTVKASPAAKGGSAPKTQPRAASNSKRSTAKDAGAAEQPEKPKANGCNVVYETFRGGPKVLEVPITDESSGDVARLKYFMCMGDAKHPYPTLDEAKAACDRFVEQREQEQPAKKPKPQPATEAICVEQVGV
jgi:hypothetical protein